MTAYVRATGLFGAGDSCVVSTWSSFLLSRTQRFVSPRRSHGSKKTPGLVAKTRAAGNVGFHRRDSGFRNGIRGLQRCVDHLHSVDEDASGIRSGLELSISEGDQ